MKNSKFVLAILVTIFSLILPSCNKDDIMPSSKAGNPEESNEQIKNIYSIEPNDNLIYLKNENDLKIFQSKLIKNGTMNDSYFYNWAKNENSLISRLKNLRDQMDSFDKKEQFLHLVEQNSDIIALDKFEDNEEFVNEINLPVSSIKYYLNKFSVIKIGEEYWKYHGDFILKSKNLRDLNHKNIKLSISNRNVSVYDKYGAKVDEMVIKNRANDLLSTFEWTKTVDVSGCKNDRRVKVALSTVFFDAVVTPGSPTFVIGMISPVVIIKPYKKGIPCIWYNYSTLVKWRNFNFRWNQTTGMFSPGGDFTFSSPSFTAPDGEEETDEKIFQFTTGSNSEILKVNGGTSCTMTYTQKRLDSTLGVMGDSWLVINE